MLNMLVGGQLVPIIAAALREHPCVSSTAPRVRLKTRTVDQHRSRLAGASAMPVRAPRAQALLALVFALSTQTVLDAQRFVDGRVSAGGSVMRGDAEGALLGGWYVDAMKSLSPDTAIAADVSGSYGPEEVPIGSERWFAIHGGLRRRFVQRPGANVSVQLLAGFARWSQRFSSIRERVNAISLLSLQPGIVIDVPLDERWAIRLRTDLRLAIASDVEAVKGGWSLAAGIDRYWGRR